MLEGLPTVVHHNGRSVEAAVLVELDLENGIMSLGNGLHLEHGIMSLGICRIIANTGINFTRYA